MTVLRCPFHWLAILVVASSFLFPSQAPAQVKSFPVKAPRKLAASEVFVVEKKDLGKCTRTLVRLNYRVGDQVLCYLVRPNTKAKLPVSLMLYSYPSGATDRFLDDNFCRRISENGIAYVGFESALTGERYKSRPMKEWFVSELRESLATTVQDVQFILDFVGMQNDLDSSRIGMFGEGSGGAIAALSAAVDARLRVVDLHVPWGDWRSFLATSARIPTDERARLSSPALLKSVKDVEPTAKLKALSKRKMRVVLLRGDASNPDGTIAAYQKSAPKTAELRLYESMTEYARGMAGGQIFEWMAKTLKSL